jgi:NAD(P)-dependent dehydrogenase (short-subunit alcohol dehydrogenase family)
MDTDHITALVTGANRGLGKHFAAQLVGRGAKVYAAARRPETSSQASNLCSSTSPTQPRCAARPTWPAMSPC